MFNRNYFSKDVVEFFLKLNNHKVKFVIIGGEAVIYYGYARLTGDTDIFYEISERNVENLWNALLDFWEGDIPGIDNKEILQKQGAIVQFGLPPNRIDLVNDIDGVSFSEVWKNKKKEELLLGNGEKLNIYLIGLKELIKNKRTSARYKDLEDLRYLQKIMSNEKLKS